MMSVTKAEGADNTVYLLPSEDAENALSDWVSLAVSEDINVLVTDPYWDVFEDAEPPKEFVGYFSKKVATLADEHDLKSQTWIQGFRLDENKTEVVHTATHTAIDSGIDSVFMWGMTPASPSPALLARNPSRYGGPTSTRCRPHRSNPSDRRSRREHRRQRPSRRRS